MNKLYHLLLVALLSTDLCAMRTLKHSCLCIHKHTWFTYQGFKAVGHGVAEIRFPAKVWTMCIKHESIQFQLLQNVKRVKAMVIEVQVLVTRTQLHHCDAATGFEGTLKLFSTVSVQTSALSLKLEHFNCFLEASSYSVILW